MDIRQLIGHPRLQLFAYPEFFSFNSFGSCFTHPLSGLSVCPSNRRVSVRSPRVRPLAAASLPYGKVNVELPKLLKVCTLYMQRAGKRGRQCSA